jgi:hypothetical protein
MVCYTLKIPIVRKHQQAVANAQLRQERIDRANLNAMTSTILVRGCWSASEAFCDIDIGASHCSGLKP